MPSFQYRGQSIDFKDGATVLESLLVSGIEASYGCKAGACQSCLLKAQPGIDLSPWQSGLNAGQKDQRLFYSCTAKAVQGMELSDPQDQTEAQSQNIMLSQLKPLAPDIMYCAFEMPKPFSYKAGQFVQLKNKHGVSRPYSIASVPGQSTLEFHIRILKEGKMSHYLQNEAQIGDTFEISSAMGNCIYPPSKMTDDILLIGTGTGLAPLWSIAQDALQNNFTGHINLYHGSRLSSGLYLMDELHECAERHSNFHYFPCLSGEEKSGTSFGRANELALKNPVKESTIYLCGHPDMVFSTKKKAFLAGASLSNIFADPFNISGDS